MKKNFIVIGLGRFGTNVVKTLAKLKANVLAVDIKEENVSAISNVISECAIADTTKIEVLKKLNVEDIDHAVVAIGNNLQASVLTVLNLKNLGVKNITVRADEESHEDIYRMLGATEVIIPETASALSLANKIASKSILDYYELSGDFVMVKVSVGNRYQPKSLMELDLRNKYGVNIVGILTNEGFNIPMATDKLYPGNVVVVVGTKQQIKKFEKYLNS